jgi:carbonic anhydrase
MDMRVARTLAAALAASFAATCLMAAADLSASSSLDRLKAGNAKFVANPAAALAIDAESRQAQTKGQSPFAIVLSCADSRVPPEVIFNVGLGDLFIVRTAGEVADKAVLASIEYGAEHLHAPLVVVMGHESCGAVKATMEAKPGAPSMGPNLDALVAAIKPAFDRMSTPADAAHLKEAVLANVEEVVNGLIAKSAIIKHMVADKKIDVVGAYYELGSGRVYFSESIALPPEPGRPAAAEHR